ncbi:FAD-dependent sensor of blue light [Nocardia alba]|uniref:FAD-dependent sensor of blue light n=2 Tax=Nocardia alba TaxID=225051 RepID=A0A4R1FSB6_9NOCA|nr:FAD-dependent sensor of blue light [Nocardia alba]
MPYTLIYSSTASFVLDDEEISVLLDHARELNAANDVTGLLVYVRFDDDRAAFVQVLEGDENAVEQTYARIQRDELHTDLLVLVRAAIPQRRFSQWSMKFVRMNQAVLQQVFSGSMPADGRSPLADRAAAERVIAVGDV